jgi:hypothetical protein
VLWSIDRSIDQLGVAKPVDVAHREPHLHQPTPAFTIKAGFLPSSLALTGAWLYMATTGLLIAETSLNLAKSHRPGTFRPGVFTYLYLYIDIGIDGRALETHKSTKIHTNIGGIRA